MIIVQIGIWSLFQDSFENRLVKRGLSFSDWIKLVNTSRIQYVIRSNEFSGSLAIVACALKFENTMTGRSYSTSHGTAARVFNDWSRCIT